MIYSLSEIDANCKKAARGAGLSWGYAEEAGKAARWLAAHQLPGAALLANYLPLRQQSQEGLQGSPRCPLLAGAGLCDAGHDVENPIALEHIAYPLLMLPYLVQLSPMAGMGLSIQWSDTHISYHNDTIYIEESTSIASSEADRVNCHWLASEAYFPINSAEAQKRGVIGQFIETDDWMALEALAHFTYVPATEASRRGAGPS